jgi:hypothetical protein
MKKRLIVLAAATAFIGVGVAPASAGEMTGNGKSTPIRDHVANSICAFSGLDDEDDDGFGRTQSWGQIPKADREFLTSIGFNPGQACNGNLNPAKAR